MTPDNLNREYNIVLQLQGNLSVADRLIVKEAVMNGLAKSLYTGDYQIQVPKGEKI